VPSDPANWKWESVFRIKTRLEGDTRKLTRHGKAGLRADFPEKTPSLSREESIGKSQQREEGGGAAAGGGLVGSIGGGGMEKIRGSPEGVKPSKLCVRSPT